MKTQLMCMSSTLTLGLAALSALHLHRPHRTPPRPRPLL